MKHKPKRGFYLALIGALGAWGTTHVEHGHIAWADFISPLHIFGLVVMLASFCGAWYSGASAKTK